ncbi:type IV pilin protein [Aquabacterium sp. A7-Y]|uniref:type IV pilin protein n=1 Tax=Aquabacterium sp. A7-Y TaxID=1349605 RepID=UPI002AC7FA99|nr:type IV pilin protein [Aquabacterium sp. A7-Y]
MLATRSYSPPCRTWGFTLIELMITVAVVAILAAVAYPAYQDQVRKSRRGAAQAVLLDIASRQQQIFLDSRAYASNVAGTGATVPTDVSRHYTVTLTAVAGTATAAPTFTAQAAPLGAQAADGCGTMSIDQAGVKSPARCW